MPPNKPSPRPRPKSRTKPARASSSGAAKGGKPRRRRRRSWAWRYRRVLLLLGLLVLTGLAGSAYVLTQVPLPETPDVNQTTMLFDTNGVRLAELHGVENRVEVPLERVPEVVRQAVIATEDRKFFRHSGLDPVGLARATWSDIRSKSYAQGGSTITQQYVKNTFVGRERSIWRKLREAVISVKLERKLDKNEILERYLNTIYFGRGAYGVQAAAQAYFRKDVDQLGLPEASYLAGIIRSPRQADVVRDPLVATSRRHRTLVAMEQERFITPQQRTEVEAVPIADYTQAPPGVSTRVARPEKGTEYFVDYVRRYLSRRYGEKAVYGGGLRVRTSIDLNLQAAAHDSVYGLLNRASDPSGALVAVDEEGRVKAMVGGRDWNASKVNLAVGREGGGAGRQGGSAFKPFVLAQAVREGYTVESSFRGPAKLVIPKADNGKNWEVENYESANYGRVNLIDATKDSVNTVYAQVITKLGPPSVVSLAKEMGIESPLQPVPSITLGTQNVSPLEMAEAYLTFATRGLHVDPRVVLEVRNAKGQMIERSKPEPERVLEREDADVVNHVLRKVVAEGSGTSADFGKPVAGKTGTSQDFGDAWFVGYTPKLSVAVWMGYPQGQSKKMLNVHGRRVNGGSFPAAIFRRFMTSATRSGAFVAEFETVSSFPGKLLSGDRISTTTKDTKERTPGTTKPRTTPTTTRSGATSTSVPTGSSTPSSTPPTTAPAKTTPTTTTPTTVARSPSTTAKPKAPPTTGAARVG